MGKTVKFFLMCSLVLVLFLFACESKPKQTPLQGPFQKEIGNCWNGKLPQYEQSADNMQNTSRSTLVLYEDGKPQGPAHSMHDDIRTKGNGRYSHWGSLIYFSASDNSDPNKNGRKYSISFGK